MNRLKECRERMKYSQKYVALSIGVSKPSISQWESGKRKISRDNLEKLSELFGVTMDYLNGNDIDEQDTTEDEQELLIVYRQLNQRGKGIVYRTAESLLADPELRQDGSAELAK